VASPEVLPGTNDTEVTAKFETAVSKLRALLPAVERAYWGVVRTNDIYKELETLRTDVNTLRTDQRTETLRTDQRTDHQNSNNSGAGQFLRIILQAEVKYLKTLPEKFGSRPVVETKARFPTIVANFEKIMMESLPLKTIPPRPVKPVKPILKPILKGPIPHSDTATPDRPVEEEVQIHGNTKDGILIQGTDDRNLCVQTPRTVSNPEPQTANPQALEAYEEAVQGYQQAARAYNKAVDNLERGRNQVLHELHRLIQEARELYSKT
jgi:hypothetical protein